MPDQLPSRLPPPQLPAARPQSAWAPGCLVLAGTIMAAGSSFFTLAAFVDLLTGPAAEAGLMLGLIAFFGIFAVGGLVLLRQGVRLGRRLVDQRTEADLLLVGQGAQAQGQQLGQRPEMPKERRDEQIVLHMARIMEGRLTPVELALRTDLSLEECKRLLDGLERQGAAESWVDANGQMIYTFPSLTPDKARSDLSSPLGATPDTFFAEAGAPEIELEHGAAPTLDFEERQPRPPADGERTAPQQEELPSSARRGGSGEG